MLYCDRNVFRVHVGDSSVYTWVGGGTRSMDLLWPLQGWRYLERKDGPFVCLSFSHFVSSQDSHYSRISFYFVHTLLHHPSLIVSCLLKLFWKGFNTVHSSLDLAFSSVETVHSTRKVRLPYRCRLQDSFTVVTQDSCLPSGHTDSSSHYPSLSISPPVTSLSVPGLVSPGTLTIVP